LPFAEKHEINGEFWEMQIIRAIGMGAEHYARTNFHLAIGPPLECPHCNKPRGLHSLGYYLRNVTSPTSGVLRISVRRFRCRQCGRTVSVLPSFAQPYRLILNATINDFFGGGLNANALSWLPLLKQYWRRFSDWIPQIYRIAGSFLERSPPQLDPGGWWRELAAVFGDVERVTAMLVREFRITLFGRYRCHCPWGIRA
jgi:hypothetical protein